MRADFGYPPSNTNHDTPYNAQRHVHVQVQVQDPFQDPFQPLLRSRRGRLRLFALYSHCQPLGGERHVSSCRCDFCEPAVPSADYLNAVRIFGAEAAEMVWRFQNGATLWELHAEEMLQMEERLATLYRSNRVEEEATAAAAAAAFERRNKVERVAIREGATRTRHGPAEIRKLPQPCKFLYNCQGTPARPTSMHITTECWSHESGVCPWAHPAMPARAAMKLADGTVVPASPARAADPMWCPQWATDRLFRPVNPNENRFAALSRPQRPAKV